MLSNPKILAAIKHFPELNINVRTFYEIVIPFLSGNKFYISKVGINKFTTYYANKFFAFDYLVTHSSDANQLSNRSFWSCVSSFLFS